VNGPVLVTGAGGCVGRALVDVLLERGVDVRGVDRPQVRPPETRAGLEWVGADIARKDQLPALVAGTRGVIHTAAIVDIGATFEAQADVNWRAVKNLYEASRAANVTRFVHFSTGSLYAPKEHGAPWREDDPLWPQNGYARTKLLAEDYLRAQAEGPRVSIVRPALIFGPYGKALVATLAPFAEMLRGLPVRLAGGPKTNLLHARDAARAAAFLLLDAEHPRGEAYNVACPDVVDVGEMLAIAMEVARGKKGLSLPLPFPTRVLKSLIPVIDRKAAFSAVNVVTDRIWTYHRRRHGVSPELRAHIDREALPFAAITAVFDASKIERLGFQWEFPTFRRAWEDTVRWYRANNWLPAAVPAAAPVGV
jgi:nucleoside-diphosphate-sugar epimerase